MSLRVPVRVMRLDVYLATVRRLKRRLLTCASDAGHLRLLNPASSHAARHTSMRMSSMGLLH